jgi:hypothetical protein
VHTFRDAEVIAKKRRGADRSRPARLMAAALQCSGQPLAGRIPRVKGGITTMAKKAAKGAKKKGGKKR